MAVIDQFGPLMDRLRNLAADAVNPPPGRAHLAPGLQVAHDDCCEGQVYVRLVGVQPTFSRPLANGRPCQSGWSATLAVGVVRCAHTVDDHGDAPTPGELDEDTLQMTADLTAVEAAIRCSDENVALTQWLPVGPSGGCVGGEWTLTAVVPLCGCSDPEGG